MAIFLHIITVKKKLRKNTVSPGPVRRVHNIRHESNDEEHNDPISSHSTDGAINRTLLLGGASKRTPSHRRRRSNASRKFSFQSEADERHQTISGSESRLLQRDRRSVMASTFFDLHDIHNNQQHNNRCGHHRLDQCEWPQCNFSCPQVRNPFTGEQMDFVDLLMQFGLDLSGIADALGMDLPTLQNMDHGELLRLLMQNSR